MNFPMPTTRFNSKGFVVLAASIPSLSLQHYFKANPRSQVILPLYTSICIQKQHKPFFHGYHTIVIYNKINKIFDIT